MICKNILLSVLFLGAFFTFSAKAMKMGAKKDDLFSVKRYGNKIIAYKEENGVCFTAIKDLESNTFEFSKDEETFRGGSFYQFEQSHSEKKFFRKKIQEFEKVELEKEEKEKTGKKLDFGSEKK